MSEARKKPPGVSGGEDGRLDCIIVTFYFPPHLGGLESYLERLATALNKKINLAVLAPTQTGASQVDSSLPYEVIRRNMLAGLIFKREFLYKPLYPLACALIFVWTLGVCLRRRPRLVCSGCADFGVAIAAAAALAGSDFTFICHGKDGHVNPTPLSWIGKRLPILWLIRRSKVCFANSEFTRRLLDPQERFGSKIRLLRVPIDKTPEPTPSEADRARAREIIERAAPNSAGAGERKIILSVGRLREHKGFQHVIAALALLKDELPDWIYVIVGGGNYEEPLRRAAEQNSVADRVVFAGTHRPPDAFYQLARIFATVTWEVQDEPEGFGMVFIEAGCFGVPSIAGDTGGMTEAVLDGETGFCVPGAQPAEIADAIGKLARDEPLRRKMGERAREHAKLFDPDRIADQFIRDCGLGQGNHP